MSDWVVISPPGGARNYLTVSLGKEYGYYKKDTRIWITDSNEYMVETNSLHYLHLEEYKEMYMKKEFKHYINIWDA